MNYTRNMRDTATYWAPGAVGIDGMPTYAAPVTVACRWQNVSVLFKDAQGRDAVSSSVVYPEIPLVIQGYLFQGVSVASDPRTVDTAREIKQHQQSPALTRDLILNKVFL